MKLSRPLLILLWPTSKGSHLSLGFDKDTVLDLSEYNKYLTFSLIAATNCFIENISFDIIVMN